MGKNDEADANSPLSVDAV